MNMDINRIVRTFLIAATLFGIFAAGMARAAEFRRVKISAALMPVSGYTLDDDTAATKQDVQDSSQPEPSGAGFLSGMGFVLGIGVYVARPVAVNLFGGLQKEQVFAKKYQYSYFNAYEEKKGVARSRGFFGGEIELIPLRLAAFNREDFFECAVMTGVTTLNRNPEAWGSLHLGARLNFRITDGLSATGAFRANAEYRQLELGASVRI